MNANPYESPGEPTAATSPRRGSWGAFVFKLVVGLGLLGLLVGLLLPARRYAPSAARRAQSLNNLKQIALGLIMYEKTFHTFPPAYTVDENGNRLHSWRTLILPFVEEAALHKKIDFSKPWNDPANREAIESEVYVYQCPSAEELPPGHTTYMAVIAPDGVFSGSEGRKLAEITDDHGGTLMVVEVEAARHAHWMKPVDVDEAWLRGLASIEALPHQGGINVTTVDGRAFFLHDDAGEEEIRALISIAGGDEDVVSLPR